MWQQLFFGVLIGLGLVLYKSRQQRLTYAHTTNNRPDYSERSNNTQNVYNANDVNASKDDYNDDPDVDCCICLGKISANTICYLPCKHAMHSVCYFDLVKNKYSHCPLCKVKMY